MDSAEVPGDVILTDVLQRRRPLRQTSIVRADSHAGALNEALEHVEELMSVEAVAGILEATWGLERGAKILHLGSGAGHMVAALRALGFNATEVECSREASLTTPVEFSKRNFHCDFTHLPFEDEEFDAVIETGLCRLEPNKVESAIAELHRVARCGVLLGSVTLDLAIDPITWLRVSRSLEQLDPALAAPSKRLFAELVSAASLYDRVEMLEDPVQFALDHYEIPNTRLIGTSLARTERYSSIFRYWAIIVLLLVQIAIMVPH